MRGIHPNGMPMVGWYERHESSVHVMPPPSCWMCGSTHTFINGGRNSLCPRCDVPNREDIHATFP